MRDGGRRSVAHCRRMAEEGEGGLYMRMLREGFEKDWRLDGDVHGERSIP